MFPNNDADLSDLQEARGRRFVFWGDAHFMILATRHLIQALEAVQALQAVPMGPKLPKALGRQTNLLRNQLEHWEDAPNKGAWKDLVDRHGAYASPYQVMFDGVNSDLKIGADKISVNELEQRLTAVLDELLRLESEF